MPHRRLTAALAGLLLLPLLAPLGLPAAPVARAAGPVKVVVVVGPTHELTASNLTWGEAIAVKAEAHGAQVIRVFYPHATWAAVSAAAVGANILVYLGHGNGFPSPYTTTLMRDRQDGMGLDPTDGAAEDQVRYYGEQYMATLGLAADAVVLLNHLCYASGDSEPGQPDPTQAVAVERVDNFAAGFIAGGASAVFALGHQDAGDILDALFGPPQTLDQLFMSTGGIGTYQFTTDSTRTPGARLHLDPETSGGYYRSLAGNLDLSSSAIVGGGAVAQPPAPALVVPPAQPPVLSSLTAPSTFTPNGDGISDTLAVSYAMSAPGTLDVSITSEAGVAVRHLVVAAGIAGRFTWDGQGDDGTTVPDGRYTLTAAPTDGASSGLPVSTWTRVLTAIRAPSASPTLFYPLDRDGVADHVTLRFTLTQPATVTWTVTDAQGRVVRTLWSGRAVQAGTWTTSWNGFGSAPGAVGLTLRPVGRYYSVVRATTAAGSVVMRRAVDLAPFRITPSTPDAMAGQSVTVTVVSAEALGAPPTIAVTQPGLPVYTIHTVKVSGLVFRGVLVLRPGVPGAVVLRVAGRDVARHVLAGTSRVMLG